eukprot:359014-Chlamydomonas_euryale.AAC.10
MMTHTHALDLQRVYCQQSSYHTDCPASPRHACCRTAGNRCTARRDFVAGREHGQLAVDSMLCIANLHPHAYVNCK